jgi:hypothetical protein
MTELLFVFEEIVRNKDDIRKCISAFFSLIPLIIRFVPLFLRKPVLCNRLIVNSFCYKHPNLLAYMSWPWGQSAGHNRHVSVD